MAIPKIVGTETEYGIIGRNDPDFDPISRALMLINSYQNDGEIHSLWDYEQESLMLDAQAYELDEFYDVPDLHDSLSINKVLTNGARFYLDHAHPEYSTPECTNVRELVRYEKAGDRILERSRSIAEQALPGGQQILIYKNNSDHKGNSYGYHENYLLDRNTPFNQIVAQLTSFLVTRQIFCGAGKVGAENGTEPAAYQLSQRADFFGTEVGLDTMVKRPLINTRDEPHANRDKYRRLHIIVGDANMSEYALYLKVGTTALVLGMIEDQFITQPLTLRDPVRAVKAISRDLTCRQPLEGEEGRTISPLDLQWEYWNLAQRYCATILAEPWALDVLQKWEYVLGRLEHDPLQLTREVDWVMKWRLLTSYMDRRGESWDSARVLMMDLQYHDIRPEKGLYYVLERRGDVERITTDAEIEAAVDEPPADTRAYFRGMCLKKFRSQVFGVNWDSLSFTLDGGPIRRIALDDPLQGTKADIAEAMEAATSAAEFVANLSWA
ncbi:MAG: proteasome accessory factor PafA2 [Nitrospinae bacterium]|nr:proteasome accessory factor PafA2 [Nitrospinota bacterium]